MTDISESKRRSAVAYRLRKARLTLWGALGSLLMAAGLSALLWREFSDANELLHHGRQTVAVALTSSKPFSGRKGRISYLTELMIDGRQTSVRFEYPVSAGQRISIIYNPSKLADWTSHRRGWFYAYIVGDSSMSAAHLVGEKLGAAYTMARLVIVFFGFGGLYLLYGYACERREALKLSA